MNTLRNRHNVGFWCANRLARRSGTDYNKGGKLAAVAEGALAGKTVVLAKPRTFVNRSGVAVADLLKRFHLRPQDLIVFCDDLDREVGALRIRGSGGHGGQNGLRSIIDALQSDEFVRIRLGIGRPKVDGVPTRDPEHVARWVLADPTAAERGSYWIPPWTARKPMHFSRCWRMDSGETMGKFNARGDALPMDDAVQRHRS